MVTLEATSDYWRIWFYLLESAGLSVQLVNARDVKNVPGRSKADKLDSAWLAKLTERGMLRPSFVPPAEIRELRDYTRLRTGLTRDRARHWSRLEKLPEDALIKVSGVASSLDTRPVRDMLEALIAGERDPGVLAGLARGKMKAKHAALAEALTGRFDDHHGELARMLLDQIDALTARVERLTGRVEELIAAIPAARGADAGGTAGPGAGEGEDAAARSAIARLDEIPGSQQAHRPGDPRRSRPGHDPVPDRRAPGVPGEAVAPHHPVRREEQVREDRSGQPLSQGRSRRGRRCGGQDRHLPGRALPADREASRQAPGPGRRRPVRSWSSSGTCSPGPPSGYRELGAGHYASRTDTGRKARSHVRQLEALGFTVTLAQAAA